MSEHFGGAEALTLKQRPDGKPWKFMIVDDSEFMIKNLSRIIVSFGGDVVNMAHDGDEAVKMFTENQANIDLITMDITMPRMNGIAALEEIMKINAQARVVVVSALGHQELVKQALLHGARHYIVKPFQRENVFRVFDQILSD